MQTPAPWRSTIACWLALLSLACLLVWAAILVFDQQVYRLFGDVTVLWATAAIVVGSVAALASLILRKHWAAFMVLVPNVLLLALYVYMWIQASGSR